MPSVSIIVPALDEAATIEQFLRQLRSRVGAVEILLVDGGSRDETPERAADICDRILTAKSSRALQMNAGAEAASGDILWFLHADCKVPEGCLEEIERALRDPVTVGGFFRIRIPRPDLVYRLTDGLAHYAGLLLRLRFGDHGFFCRRAAFEKIGGSPDVTLMEDAEFFRKLRRLGPVAVIPARLLVSPRRYEAVGPLRLTLTYGFIAILYAARIPLPILAAVYRHTCIGPAQAMLTRPGHPRA